MPYFTDNGRTPLARGHGLLTVLARPGSRMIGMAAHRVKMRGDTHLYDIWLTGATQPLGGDWTLDEATGEFVEVKGEAGR